MTEQEQADAVEIAISGVVMVVSVRKEDPVRPGAIPEDLALLSCGHEVKFSHVWKTQPGDTGRCPRCDGMSIWYDLSDGQRRRI